MRAIWIQPDPRYLAERARLGLDKKDEVWDGVLHMVPPPAYQHEAIANELLGALLPLARRLGLLARTAGLFDRDDDYRVPDLSIIREDHISNRGIEGAELVIEVLSPNDESRDKFPFYAKLGVREFWLIEPRTRALELYLLRDGAYVRQQPPLVSPVLGVTLEQRDGQLVIGDAVI